jgi:hypothetical protein
MTLETVTESQSVRLLNSEWAVKKAADGVLLIKSNRTIHLTDENFNRYRNYFQTGSVQPTKTI